MPRARSEGLNRDAWAAQSGAEIIAFIEVAARRVHLSESFERLLGYPPDHAEDTARGGVFDPEDLQALLSTAKTGVEDLEFRPLKCRLAQHDRARQILAAARAFGRNREFVLVLAPELVGPQIQGILGRSERRYQALIEHTSDVISVLGADGAWLESSSAGSRLMGYPHLFEPDGGIFSLIHPDDLATALEAFNGVVSGTRDPDMPAEFRIRAANGDWHTFESYAKDLLDNEDVQGIVITSRDVTDRRNAERLLKESEERFRLLAETATEGVAIGEGGVVVSANAAMAALYGYSRDEIVGLSLEAFLPPESWASVLENIAAGRDVDSEFVGVRKDGSRFPVWVRARSTTYQGRAVRVCTITDLTQYKRNAAREERHRIARDLHDGLAQELAFIASATRSMAPAPTDAVLVNRLASAAERALDEARRAISLLSADVDEPFADVLVQTAEDLAARHGLSLTVDLEPVVEVPAETCEAILRIVREAITNTGTHANATGVRLRLWRDDAVRVMVADNGIGFDPADVGRGFGLLSMRERAEAIGGVLLVRSIPGRGTELELVVP